MYLETEDARLYYEMRGEGKPLLLIHGVVVDADLYREAAGILSKFYQVITYDRRGNSRSVRVKEEAEAAGSMPVKKEAGAAAATLVKEKAGVDISAQVQDVLALFDHLGIERAFVAGASAGGIVGLELLRAAPERVAHLLLYEPPLTTLLSDPEERAWVLRIEELTAEGKINRAMLEFVLSLGESDDRKQPKLLETERREANNFSYFLEQEFSLFMHYQPDASWFCKQAQRITVAVGERSGESRYVQAAKLFQQRIGCELLHFPGCHNLPADLPADFANCLMGVSVRAGWSVRADENEKVSIENTLQC